MDLASELARFSPSPELLFWAESRVGGLLEQVKTNATEIHWRDAVNLRHIKASESRRNVASRSGCFSGFGRVGFTPFSVFLQRGKWRPEGCPGDRGI